MPQTIFQRTESSCVKFAAIQVIFVLSKRPNRNRVSKKKRSASALQQEPGALRRHFKLQCSTSGPWTFRSVYAQRRSCKPRALGPASLAALFRGAGCGDRFARASSVEATMGTADSPKGGNGTQGGRGGVHSARCIALIGPFASGKTTLLEAILARTGGISRQGSIAAKSTVGDASPEARDHIMSVALNVADVTFLDDNSPSSIAQDRLNSRMKAHWRWPRAMQPWSSASRIPSACRRCR